MATRSTRSTRSRSTSLKIMSTRWYCSAIPSLPTLAGSSLPLGLGPWALASIVWISVDQNHGTGVSLEAPDFDPQMAQCLRTWWTSREKRRCNNGAHPGGFGASICHGSKGVILLLDHRIFGGPKRNVTPRAPQSATFCRTRLAVETFKEDLHQPPHPRRRIVPNIRMFQVSLFVSTANCPKETGPPSVVTLKISSSYMLQIITGWKPPAVEVFPHWDVTQ